MIEPERIYERRKNKYRKLSKKTEKGSNKIVLLRMTTALIIFSILFFLYRVGNDIILWSVLVFLLGIFIYLIKMHNDLKNRLQDFKNLEEINKKALERLEGKWVGFKDKGEEFINTHHAYTYDLDIFGRGSLFQYINHACTSLGRERLAFILSTPLDKKEEIYKRQNAIKELAKKRWWRQKFLMESMKIKEKNKSYSEMVHWAKKKKSIYTQRNLRILLILLPLMTIILLINGYIFNAISKTIPISFVILQFLMGFLNSKNINEEFNQVYKYKDEIKAYWKMLEVFEKTSFTSPTLNHLKNRLKNKKGSLAVQQLKQLDYIVSSIENRRNIFFFPIKVLTLWDYQSLVRLYGWKNTSGDQIEDWLWVIGELEALSSLSSIGYDHATWALPQITEKASVFKAKEIAHPLLIKNPVANTIEIKEPSRILLITGSNMAGKSTFLRTVGINLVLAYSGTFICGKSMTCSLMNLQTCMRINDDLEAGISSFYGELKRIKNIVEASQEETQVFFLLDEIFKGTNSYDRHTGAKMLLKQLYQNHTMGLVSTHDLELGDLEKTTAGNIKNYHFQEHYKNGEIQFDYKLKKGVSTTRNAIYLMKMAGVHIED